MRYSLVCSVTKVNMAPLSDCSSRAGGGEQMIFENFPLALGCWAVGETWNMKHFLPWIFMFSRWVLFVEISLFIPLCLLIKSFVPWTNLLLTTNTGPQQTNWQYWQCQTPQSSVQSQQQQTWSQSVFLSKKWYLTTSHNIIITHLLLFLLILLNNLKSSFPLTGNTKLSFHSK